MVNNLSFVTDPHGKFYAGMTLREAKENGTDKSFWHRDFHNLDKNNDGVLSVSEVMNERKRSSKIDKWTAGIFSVLGILDLAADSTSKTFKLIDILFDVFIVGSSVMNAYKIDKGTQRMENALQRMAENKNLDLNA